MLRYKIGNLLRGYIHLEANSNQEAWEKGREKFNQSFPTDHGTGRQVELYVLGPVRLTPKYTQDKPEAPLWHPVLLGTQENHGQREKNEYHR